MKKIKKYVWKKENKILEIEKTNSKDFDYKYLVYLHGNKWNGNGFNSKIKALKFIKSYMKKH